VGFKEATLVVVSIERRKQMAEKLFRISIEGHLDEKRLREFCLKHHKEAVVASKGLITSKAPEGDVEYMLGYATRCFAGDISHNYKEESFLEDIESWPYNEIPNLPGWEGWKPIEILGIFHPATVLIELNGDRAIAFFDDMDFGGYFILPGDEDKEAETLEEAIAFHTGKDAEFYGETMVSQRQGSIAIWKSTAYKSLEIRLDTKTGTITISKEE
jgi:hypothetical protein